ncbi:MAG TPA: hypothetical protein VFJ15_01145 [Oleiagrimonas sp.]|nr:hypothetical protein [Oleiagrimonas sp.]
MPILTVTIAFQAAGNTWNVSRAHTVPQTHDTYDDAIRGACEIAVHLRGRMRCDMRFRMCDADGHWYAFTSMNDTRSAAVLAERLLYMFRSGPSEPTAPRGRALVFVPLAQMQAMAMHGARALVLRRVPA